MHFLTRLVPLVALVAAAPVYAQSNSAAEAERTRLAEEMKRLSSRNAWRGVDEAYRALEKLSADTGVALTYRDHYVGAVAARELGDINTVYTRLLRARSMEDSDEVKTWIADIDVNYGQVQLKADPKYNGKPDLLPDEMPFAPDQRRSIESAQAQIASTRSYDGILPLGKYRFGDREFTVEGNGAAPIVLALMPTAARSGEGGGLAYVGPRVDLGVSFTQTTSPNDAAIQGAAFGGVGARIGVGLEFGFSTRFGVLAQVGYHDLFGGAPKDDAAAAFGTSGSSLHLGYGWLGAAYRLGDLRLAAGPVFGVGVARARGMNGYCDTASAEDPLCAGVDNNDDVAAYAPMQGVVRAGGAELGLFYGFLNFGKLQSGIGLHAGALTDTGRWYPWGQLAFTLAPATYRRDG